MATSGQHASAPIRRSKQCAGKAAMTTPIPSRFPADVRAICVLAAPLIGMANCLVVSGNFGVLYAAHRIGAIGLGCECGRDRRKHLAAIDAPVVSGLATLTRALLS